MVIGDNGKILLAQRPVEVEHCLEQDHVIIPLPLMVVYHVFYLMVVEEVQMKQ